MNAASVFETSKLSFRYEGAAQPALDGIDLTVRAGSLYAIIGPNGSGKSTLLKLLLGVLRPHSGHAYYSGQPVQRWSRRALAKQVGVVPQGEETVFPISVSEMVAMGRYPHLGVLGRPGPRDHEAVEEAMHRCDVIAFADRPISKLSGGERQRVLIARALAQRPTSLLLDEPTVSLDIRHEMEIFEILAELSRSDGVTVVLVTHHLNLAARYAQRLLLLDRGAAVAEGPPGAVLDGETIEHVYQWSVVVNTHPGPGRDAGAPQITPLAGDRPSE